MSKHKLNRETLVHFTEAIEGFAGQHDLELFVHNGGMHLRIFTGKVTLDVWPSTGRYYILQSTFGNGLRMHEKGRLPYAYDELDKFLSKLLLKDR